MGAYRLQLINYLSKAYGFVNPHYKLYTIHFKLYTALGERH